MTRIGKSIRMAGVVAVLALGAVAAGAGSGEQGAAFTPDKPENQGLTASALEKLTKEMNRLVAEGHVVGAELVVLKNRRVVLHETAGWKDRETRTPLGRNTIFSLRAMTKPLIGLAAQMLIDEGRLSPEDKVSRFLPAFGQGPAAAITVEHLLTQRSGLPKGRAAEFNLAASLQDLAQESAAAKLAFEPGRDFLASDAGANVLAAVIEKAGGLDLEGFLRRRLLEPLGMKDTFVYSRRGDPRADRIASAYVGIPGNWNRNWSTNDGPPYGFAMGSQSFYSTPLDYARLLALLLDDGRLDGRALLSAAALKRILTPVSAVPTDTGFSGVKLAYGQMMQLMVPADNPNRAPVAFGHGSSEGILAWAWPGREVMLLFFTQTRGVSAEVPMENAADLALIHPGQAAEVPQAYRPLVGKYLDVYAASGLEEISIVFLNGRLAIDIPSQAVFVLDPPDAQGRFPLSRNPAITISFVRNDRGEVTALRRNLGEKTVEIPRLGTPEAKSVLDKMEKMREGWTKYLGVYQTEQPGQTVEIILRGGGLGILRPGQSAPLLLQQPDAQGRWRLKANPAVYVTFEESSQGEVISFTFHAQNGQALVRTRIGPSKKR